MSAKSAVAFRLSDEAVRLLDALAAKLGVNKTAAIELAIRQMAKGEKVE